MQRSVWHLMGAAVVVAPVLIAAEPAGGGRAAQTACTVQLASPMLFPLGSIPGGVVIDSACQFAYVTNTVLNRVEVISLATLTLQEPIQVGAQPIGLDITPDGELLYVANLGGNNLSVVSLSKRVEIRKIRMPYQPQDNDRPYSVVIMNNGRAFYTTTSVTSTGFVGQIMELNLGTDQSTPRADVVPNGVVTQRLHLRRGRDRFAFVKPESSFFQVYLAATNTLSASRSIQASDAASNANGTKFFTVQGSLVLDAGLNQIGSIANSTGSRGAVVDAAGVVAYRSIESRVEFLDLVTFLETGEVALGDSVTGTSSFANAGQMAISADGTLLAVTTNTGVVLLKPPAGS